MEAVLKKLNVSIDKSFYKDVWNLALPLALQSLFMVGVNTVDSIMLGRLGEVSLSACSIAVEPFTVISGILRGASLGSAVLIAQYWGKKDTDTIRKVFSISTKIVLLVGLICMFIVQAFPSQVLHIFTDDEEVVAQAVPYLKIAAITYALYGFSDNYMLATRSLQNANMAFITNVISYSLNILFDYIFIFGKFGLPEMGVTGAAVGLLLSRIVEFAICYIHLFFMNKKFEFHFKDFLLFDTKLFKDILIYGIPSLLSETIFTLGMAAYSVVFGHLGTTAMSAKSISEVISKIPQAIFTGLSSSSAVLIGKTIGEGKSRDELHKQVNSFFWLVACGVVVDMLFILAFRVPIINMYNITDETKAMTMAMTVIAILTTVGRGYEALYVCGILVGGGDTRYILIFTTIVMWVVVMPLAFLGAFAFKWSPVIVYLILRMDYVIKGVVGFFRTRGNKWVKDVTRKA